MAENLNRDAFRIRRGLDALGGNRLAGLIQSSNYQKILRSYRSRYVERRKDKKTGDLYWFDKKTNKRVTDQDIHKNVITNVTGSETPIKDLRYISATQTAKLERNLGNLDDGVSVRDVLFNVRNKFSPEIKDEETGEVIGTELEDKRNKRANLLLNKAKELKAGTSYDTSDSQNQNLKNLVNKKQTQNTEQLVDQVIDSNGGDSKVVRHYNNQRPSPGTVDLLGEIENEIGVVNKGIDEQTKRNLGLEVGSVNRETSSLSINSSDATPGNKTKEKLTMPKTWARGQGRKLKDVNKDTEAYLRQEGWGEALDKARDKDELLRAARTDQLLISKGFVHTDDGVFKIDKKEEVLTA